MLGKMRYRLALDLGAQSLGWALIRLNCDGLPCAVVKAGVRIFSDGRNPKDGSSLAVTRRMARAMRRRRDRLLRRKARLTRMLIEHGFFPREEAQRKTLVSLNPYRLRAKGLDEALTPSEFGRALFHINQRRGFKSSRKIDKKEKDGGALKAAIRQTRERLAAEECRTVGEWLNKHDINHEGIRARYRERRITSENGKSRIDKSYDLYIDRAMIEAEFDTLWAKQAGFNPTLFNGQARNELKDTLLNQRPLKPVRPGRCSLIPEKERAPLALPSTQRFRIYQEVNNLRVLTVDLKDQSLTLAQRDAIVAALERSNKVSFTKFKSLLKIGGCAEFNLEDMKRQELKGNTTSAILAKADHFGAAWYDFGELKQDAIVVQLLNEENESRLVDWLRAETGIDEPKAERIANAVLPEGYGSLSREALARILPELRKEVISYDKAVIAAGFPHHSQLSAAATGELLESLPYYGEPMQRHVGFGTGDPEDPPEKRFGRIANPTVHIGLNQVRKVVNALIARYGHPSEVIIELARELKQGKERRNEENRRQAENQKRNDRFRKDIAGILEISEERVKRADIQKMILWQELNQDPANRRCPYSGVQISERMLLSDEVEIEHILPFSRTLDDSLNNKTVAMRQANRIKGSLTPWEAFGRESVHGFDYGAILERAKGMPKAKAYRFAEDGYQKWLKDDAGFLARALNDTRYMNRVAKEYLSLICPNTRVIPGRMTAQLRGKFGLNTILGPNGEKNRNDHRHHAVDACVIGVTDQGMLQRFAQASADAREKQLTKLVETMPLPWPTFREHVARAIGNIYVSHKPDHGHEGAMHNDTAYGLLGSGRVVSHKMQDGQRVRIEETLKVIELSAPKANDRHGLLPDGTPRPYKGYKGDSNYCIEIVRDEKGKWQGEVISTYDAYQYARIHGVVALRNNKQGVGGKPLVMRLIINDMVKLIHNGTTRILRLATLNASGRMAFSDHNEANVDARVRAKELSYTFKMAGTLQTSKARRLSVSPIGELRDPGFKD